MSSKEEVRMAIPEKQSPSSTQSPNAGNKGKITEAAHSHGGKSQPQNESAMNRMANSDQIHRTESPQRKIITGAALGKTGQRNKES